MATHDYVIDNSTGANVRADLNLVLQAILSNNSSSSAPSTTAAYMWWADTTNGILKIRNSANNAWVELLQLDGTLTLEDGTVSAPALAFRDDLDTGIYSSAANTFNVATGGVTRMELGLATIFNQDGADVDFRVESSGFTHMLFVDAGNNRVGLGCSAPDSEVVVQGAAHTAFQCWSGSASTKGFIQTVQDSDVRFGGSTNHPISFYQNGNERMRISDTHLLVGQTSALSSQAGSIQAAGPIIAKSFINSHTTNAAVIDFQSNTFLLRAYGASSGDGLIQFNVAGGGDATDGEAMRLIANKQLLIGTTTNNNVNANLVISTNASPGYYSNPSCLSITSSNSADANAVEIHQGRYNKQCMTLSHAYNQSATFAIFEQADVQVGFISGNGSATTYGSGSDYRLKENIENITDGITRLKQLLPRKFNWIADSTNTLVDGFIAHEVSLVIPEAVVGEKDAVREDGSIKTQVMDYGKVTPLLTAALQEAIAKIEVLETKVAALEAA